MERDPIFHDFAFGESEREEMDRDGHIAFPGLPSNARWISEEYEKRRIRGAESLLSLY